MNGLDCEETTNHKLQTNHTDNGGEQSVLCGIPGGTDSWSPRCLLIYKFWGQISKEKATSPVPLLVVQILNAPLAQ